MKWQIKDIITAGAIISLLAVIVVQFISITRLTGLESTVRSLEADMKLMRMYVDASEQKNNLYDEVLQNTLEVTENMAKVLEMMDEKIRYMEDLIEIID